MVMQQAFNAALWSPQLPHSLTTKPKGCRSPVNGFLLVTVNSMDSAADHLTSHCFVLLDVASPPARFDEMTCCRQCLRCSQEQP